VKASLAENKIKQIKQRLEKYMAHTGERKWIDVLPKIIAGINKTFNRNMGMAPIDVNSKAREKEVFINLYKHILGAPAPPSSYKKGDRVRISHLRSRYAKGYMQNYSQEEFLIKRVLPKFKENLLLLQDQNKQNIVGQFYPKETKQVL